MEKTKYFYTVVKRYGVALNRCKYYTDELLLHYYGRKVLCKSDNHELIVMDSNTKRVIANFNL